MASTTPVPEEVTAAWLETEMQQAHASLKDKEHRLAAQQQGGGGSAAAATTRQEETTNEPLSVRLFRLGRTARDLQLLQDVTAWNEQFAKDAASSSRMETDEDEDHLLSADTKRCWALGELLCRHAANEDDGRPTTRLSPLWIQLYQQEYEPLYAYLRSSWLLAFRQTLQQSRYSTPVGCQQLVKESQTQTSNESSFFAKLANSVESFTRLQSLQQQVWKHASQSSKLALDHDPQQKHDAVLPLVLELCRPLVQRLQFHFVQPSENRPLSTRMDRLPEWLLHFVKEKVFGDDGPWQLVSDGLDSHVVIESDGGGGVAPSLSLAFLNELVRLIQWVLQERDFFRHASIAGPTSKPLLLCNAIEQLLQFDEYLQFLVLPANANPNRLLSLMDIFVAGDEELLAWWLEREREAVFSTLFQEEEEEDASADKPASADRTMSNYVSPRAELFCSLIHSIQTKASVFSFSGPYIAAVASPLCMHFLEAVHASSTDLKSILTQRKLPTDKALLKCFYDWIELINGTHMATLVLLQGLKDNGDDNEMSNEDAPSLSGDQDLARFGRSLDHLENVLVDEFATSFVDRLLLEQAKFAGYLMRSSHILSLSHHDSADHDETEGSPDLQETLRLLSALLEVCDSITGSAGIEATDKEELPDAGSDDMATFAPRMMRDCVLSRVAAQLLEVVLDLQGMTPDLYRPGCLLFARDVNAMLGISLVPTPALRLLEITKLMSMESPDLVQLGNILCELAGRPPPLTEDAFTVDSRLFDEAMSMIRAKGLIWVELSDVLSILNRRRDLGQTADTLLVV